MTGRLRAMTDSLKGGWPIYPNRGYSSCDAQASGGKPIVRQLGSLRTCARRRRGGRSGGSNASWGHEAVALE